jgi:DNA (cytosine-5)-methyltransferase 1
MNDWQSPAPFRVLSLFAGIGGFDLGLERTGGFKTVAFCEIDPFCRRVLAKHWPEVPCYDDVRTLTADTLARDGLGVDVICGGFPCQDISAAGKGAGLAGERSGLWSEYQRLIRDTRPQFALVENSPRLRSRGLDAVLRGLDALGYDAVWDCIPAAELGAPHERDRVWIVASNTQGHGRGSGWAGRFVDRLSRLSDAPRWNPANTDRKPALGPSVSWRELSAWPDEPALLGVGDGVPNRVDRVRALGNAVVPHIPELIGRAILAAEAA